MNARQATWARDVVFPVALDALAFLRLLASFVFSELLDPVIDFYGNFTYEFATPYYFATLAGSGVFSGISRFADRNVLVISKDTLEFIYALGLDNLLKLYQPDGSKSEFERLIIRAIGWFSSASVPMRYENRLLNYVTSLEMFLSVGNTPVAQNVSEGTALFIADEIEAGDASQRLSTTTITIGVRSHTRDCSLSPWLKCWL